MDFFTRVSSKKSVHTWTPETRFVSMGSCFAAEVGQRLYQAGMSCSSNKLGICFNPQSLLKHLEYALGLRAIHPELFVQRSGGGVVHLDFHSQYEAESQAGLRDALQSGFIELRRQLESCDYLILTFGTAFVYRDRASQEIVANCHQQPQQRFERYRLLASELLLAYQDFLQTHLPNTRVLVSVSPIRYIRDGLIDNSWSKGFLRLFCAELEASVPQVEYVPAFEIVIDELRDYRWFERDLVHLRQEAVDYVWERVLEVYASRELCDYLADWQNLKARLDHRPRNRRSGEYWRFLKETEALLQQWPGKTREYWLAELRQQLARLQGEGTEGSSS